MHRGGNDFDTAVLKEVLRRAIGGETPLTLVVGDGEGERIIQFLDGGVRVVSNGRRALPDLARYLVSRHLIDIETLESVVERTRAGGGSFRTALLRDQHLPREAYSEVVTRLARDAVLDLVFWRGAAYSVHAKGEAPKAIEEAIDATSTAHCDLSSLAAALDQWSAAWPRLEPVLRSDRSRFALRESERAAIDAHEGHLSECLEACREECDLRTIWGESSRELPEIAESLAELVTLGWVQVTSPDDLRADNDLAARCARLEEHVKGFLAKDLVREKLAKLYLQSGQRREAARELVTLGRGEMNRAEWDRAIERMNRVLELFPEHLEALEAVVRIHMTQGDEKRAVAVAAAHAKVLLERGHASEALTIARKLRSLPHGAREAQAIESKASARGVAVRGSGGSSRRLRVDAFPPPGPGEGAAAGIRPAPLAPNAHAAIEISDDASAPSRVPSTSSERVAAAAGAGPRGPWVLVGVLAAACVCLALLLARSSATATVGSSGGAKAAHAQAGSEASVSAAAESLDEEVADDSTVSDASSSVIVADLVREPDFERRVVADDRVLTCREGGTLTIRDRWSDEVLFEAPGAAECRWAVGFGARRILRWRAGEPGLLHLPESGRAKRLEWSIPADTAAVAVGPRVLALRRGAHTIFYTWEGRPLDGGMLPLWTEGVFTEDGLVVQDSPLSESESRNVWVVRLDPLKVLWKVTIENGRPHVH